MCGAVFPLPHTCSWWGQLAILLQIGLCTLTNKIRKIHWNSLCFGCNISFSEYFCFSSFLSFPSFREFFAVVAKCLHTSTLSSLKYTAITLRSFHFIVGNLPYSFFQWRNSPQWGHGLLIIEASRSQTRTTG
jgi:hypothetical protein